MSLSNLNKLSENIQGRILDGFIKIPDGSGGTEWQPMGHLQDVTISFSPVTQDADVANRQKQIAADVEVTLVMQQTTDVEFAAMADLATPSGSGHKIKLVDRLTAQADVAAADGYTFENVLPRFEGEFDGSGEGSNFTAMFGGRVLIGQISAPFTGTLTFDV
ncbi:hypothetical protein [Salinibacter phage M31CR41-2]|uniref:Tail tube protein n=1 Tax=Salinibacter phage M31CR41-2 TaxID=2681614 RepID=A0A2I6UH52_9CAUD|nr:hypothetical protein FGG68_gp60 [Salinibacter phage M31CR41-2]AUO79292.1 hypothetical protein [Salinibacter phage M31CR41-2]